MACCSGSSYLAITFKLLQTIGHKARKLPQWPATKAVIPTDWISLHSLIYSSGFEFFEEMAASMATLLSLLAILEREFAKPWYAQLAMLFNFIHFRFSPSKDRSQCDQLQSSRLQDLFQRIGFANKWGGSYNAARYALSAFNSLSLRSRYKLMLWVDVKNYSTRSALAFILTLHASTATLANWSQVKKHHPSA